MIGYNADVPRLIPERQLVPVWHAFFDYPLTEAYLMQSEKTKVFIEKARAIHGDRYDYSLVDYVRSRDKIKIICKSHGAFEQLTHGHISGKGCEMCGHAAKNMARRNAAAKSFKDRAIAVHGVGAYGYENVVYIRTMSKVKITCFKHGDFEQAPDKHLRGRGCPHCGIQQGALSQRSANKNAFEARARVVHGDTYDYSLARYVYGKRKVKILCSTHGEFTQTPQKHLSGSGCPQCVCCGGWAHAETHLYILSNGKGQCKIGISIDPEKRLNELNRDAPFSSTFKASWTLPTYRQAYEVEQRIHKKLKHLNCGYSGFDGATEWFAVTPHKAVKIAERAVSQVEQLTLF